MIKGLILEDGALEQHLVASASLCTGAITFTALTAELYYNPISTAHTIGSTVLATLILVMTVVLGGMIHKTAAEEARRRKEE